MTTLWCPHALLPTGWARDVLLRWDDAGMLTDVLPGQPRPAPGTVECLEHPAIPGVPNLHSHAFQRAFAGLTEYRSQARDSFWSWREAMYRFAGRITPAQLEAVATWVYLEMLEAGYTSVCEFNYLHHDLDGRPYADDAGLMHALLRAARRTGIGLTLLPVLYQASGFGARPPHEGQRRFLRRADELLRLLERLQPACRAAGVRLGLAPHSLRAVPPEALAESLAGLAALDPTAPVHIHVAEQAAEVDACLAWCGQRPVDWLLDHAPVDRRWCLVHATHMTPQERARAARSGAVAGLCPTTEANLGDGCFDLPAWQAAGGAWGIGSDSQVCVNAAEELMLLEYAQRLWRQARNVLASDRHPAVAEALLHGAVAGGAQAAGRAVAGLAPGQQADLVELDGSHPDLAGLDPPAMLSAHVFAAHRHATLRRVLVAGQTLVVDGRHRERDAAAAAFVAARRQLLAAG